jgi:hypothetical protein
LNPTILKADILGFAPEFNALDVVVGAGPNTQLDNQLVILNSMADSVVSDTVYPSIAPDGDQFSPIYIVKMLVVCHWLKLTINTEGRVSSDKVGDNQTNYSVPDVNSNADWNNTIYGQRYVQFRRIYAPGISQAPAPGREAYPGLWP